MMPVALEHVLLDLSNFRIVLLEQVGVVHGHFLGTTASHEPELLAGDTFASQRSQGSGAVYGR